MYRGTYSASATSATLSFTKLGMDYSLTAVPSFDSTKGEFTLKNSDGTKTLFTTNEKLDDYLMQMDEDGAAIPALAETTDISDDGCTWTFHLRDAKWSNGTPVTANDFVFAWRRICKNAGEYAYMMSDIGQIKGAAAIVNGDQADETTLAIKAVDDKTLEVQLEVPVPYFDSLMYFPTFYPINEEFYNSDTSFYIIADIDNCYIMIFRGSVYQWELDKIYPMSCGKPGSSTPRGEYEVTGKLPYFYSHGSLCYYATQWNGPYYFHSVTYNYNGTIQNPTLGAHISAGCIRLDIDVAEWIYDNVPEGTNVRTI